MPDNVDTSTERVVALLQAGIPLTLLIDLVSPDPHSEELYENERPLSPSAA